MFIKSSGRKVIIKYRFVWLEVGSISIEFTRDILILEDKEILPMLEKISERLLELTWETWDTVLYRSIEDTGIQESIEWDDESHERGFVCQKIIEN